jgi:hypothetical protein
VVSAGNESVPRWSPGLTRSLQFRTCHFFSLTMSDPTLQKQATGAMTIDAIRTVNKFNVGGQNGIRHVAKKIQRPPCSLEEVASVSSTAWTTCAPTRYACHSTFRKKRSLTILNSTALKTSTMARFVVANSNLAAARLLIKCKTKSDCLVSCSKIGSCV